ncbi:MAG: hypothetical protein IPI81_12705 [Flavobacteriales bacterium]|nr:hypothetical protein [Flavobacteriales bacterium]MCC6937594.1 hypothetical protein [Flavobacteriales bacterium]
MAIGINTTILLGACAALLLSASKPPPTWPKYKVNRKTMTVHAKHDRLGDVGLYKWAGLLPDTVTDTLRFFARHGAEFINENALNRLHCVMIENDLIEQNAEESSDITPEQMVQWRDSLEQIYREIRYTKLDLLSDSAMLFDSVSTKTFSPRPLAAIMEPEHWYLFNLWSAGGSHQPNYFWFVSFYLDKDGAVQHWLNSKKTYPAYGGSTKNL